MLVACYIQIKWENRFRCDTYERCLVTVDGTDFQIYEPTPFSTEWYSHKFDGPGLRYEIGVAIKTGDIVWFNGPFPCGSHNDLKIFRRNMKLMLGPGEMVIADRGYIGDEKVVTPDNFKNARHKKAMGIARARHETINGRLKNWGILKQIFRHHRNKHHIVFKCILVLTQIDIETGNPPFQVTGYHDSAFAI